MKKRIAYPLRMDFKLTPNDRQRFLSKAKVIRRSGCWEWQGYKDAHGYGKFWIQNSVQWAHRVSWNMHNGPIPEGFEVHHTCHNHSCVRPSHLSILTVAENRRTRDDDSPVEGK